MAPRKLFRIMLAVFVQFASMAHAADPTDIKTVEIEILSTSEGLIGFVLPDRVRPVAVKCSLFGTSKLVIAPANEKADTAEYGPGSNVSIKPTPKLERYNLSDDASSILCRTYSDTHFTFTYGNGVALLHGVDIDHPVMAGR